MSLYFRTEHRKNFPPMIVALRLIVNEAGKRSQKIIGSFNNLNDDKRLNQIINKLTKEERYEFDNFLNVLKFSERTFEVDAQALDYRFIIRATSGYKSALIKLWDSAKDYGINFIPENEMITHALGRGKIVEQYLKVLSNNEFSALTDLGIPLTKDDAGYPDTDSRNLLEAALECAGSSDTLAEEFNYFCKKFQKKPSFKPHYFAFLINPAQGYSVKRWYYSIALEILLKYGKKPHKYVPVQIMVAHWLRFHEQSSLSATLTMFDSVFPDVTKKETCHNVIKHHFLTNDLRKMGGFTDSTTEPSPFWAIDRWVRKWKKNHRDEGAKAATKEFSRQFPSYAKNLYFKELIDSHFT